MIPIRNIYYMLSYAFQVLNEKGYKSLETERFDNVEDLCAAILVKGVSIQLKRGLNRQYVEKTDALTTVRGKIQVSDSLKTMCYLQLQQVCSYDEFSENEYLNRIIKTTMLQLLRADIQKSRKKELRKLLVFFGNIDTLDKNTINWKIQYNRNNQTYQMLISVCYLIIKSYLQTEADGSTRLMTFFEEWDRCRLYEKFLLGFYQKEYKSLIKAEASYIDWFLDDDGDRHFLPKMHTDITLSQGNRFLIIDAKFYTHFLAEHQGKRVFISNNLYQIFAYVKNKQVLLKDDPEAKVSGMLLYAQTDDTDPISKTYEMSGNRISLKTLDLNCDFSEIAAQLDTIVTDCFEIVRQPT